jgi:hypothetical protein
VFIGVQPSRVQFTYIEGIMNVFKVAHWRKKSILIAERVTITILRGISGAGVIGKLLKNRQAISRKQKRTINDRTV